MEEGRGYKQSLHIGGGQTEQRCSSYPRAQPRNFTWTSYPTVHTSPQPQKFPEGSSFISVGPVYTNTLVTQGPEMGRGYFPFTYT